MIVAAQALDRPGGAFCPRNVNDTGPIVVPSGSAIALHASADRFTRYKFLYKE